VSTIDTVRGGSFETPNVESSRSAVTWAAIVGGAVGAISATLVLTALETALGFASISPWSNASASAAALGVGAVIWLVVTQWLSAAFGGYLTGRLRTKWAAMNTDEVFFRDTAHGFLSWGLSTAIVALALISAAGSTASLTATVASGAVQGAAQSAGDAASGPMAYFTDSLFRAAPIANPAGEAAPAASTDTNAAAPQATDAPTASNAPTAPSNSVSASTSAMTGNTSEAEVKAEGARIFLRGMSSELTPSDRTYLAQLISQQTGINQAEAEKRIDDTTAAAKESADIARKAASAASFAVALSLLIGAFVASVGGAIGGRHRDEL
jgi:hypothetical protein